MSQGVRKEGHNGLAPPPKGRAGFSEDYDKDPYLRDANADVEGEPRTEAEMSRTRKEYLEHEADGERPYKVTKFEPKYEPYVILKKEGVPWCDERFVGYGANKAVGFIISSISSVYVYLVYVYLPQSSLLATNLNYPMMLTFFLSPLCLGLLVRDIYFRSRLLGDARGLFNPPIPRLPNNGPQERTDP